MRRFWLAFMGMAALAAAVVYWRWQTVPPVTLILSPAEWERGDSVELLDGREPSTVYDNHRDHLKSGRRHP